MDFDFLRIMLFEVVFQRLFLNREDIQRAEFLMALDWNASLVSRVEGPKEQAGR